jgi:uncharacterized protein (DUF488 family)
MEQQASTLAVKTVYTAGYEGESVDTFFEKLLEAGIQRLLDVRYNAISRKYGFSKGRLREQCKQRNIDYVHLRQLWIPSSQRKSLKTDGDYKKLMREYERSILPKVPDVQREALQLVQELPSVLVCFEADVSYCHRGRLAEAVSSDAGMTVVHLS